MKDKKFIPGIDWVWYAPNTTDAFDEKEIKAVETALRKGWLTVGDITTEFENKISDIFGKNFGLFVNSGSSANLLALKALKFPRGSEIITPACNFNTTVAPIIQTGLVPVFVDVKLRMYTVDVNQLKEAVSDKTVAVMAPHLLGNFIEVEKIRDFCDKHHLVFIEDSCDTIGGKINGNPSGKWSDVTTTSFYASHVITSGGAGGMLMTSNEKLREQARLFRDWGRGIPAEENDIDSRLSSFEIEGEPYDSAFVFVEQGYNFRPTEMQAAFGLKQLERLDEFMEKRKNNFDKINKFLSSFRNYFILPESIPNSEVNWLAYPITIKENSLINRNKLVRYLEHNKIQTRPLFSGNILKHPAYKNVNHRQVGNLKNSNLILRNSFLLGLHHGMTNEMLQYVFENIENYLKENG